MSMFWGVWLIGTIITIACVVCLCYLFYLCVRALRKYLNDNDTTVQVEEKGGRNQKGIVLAVVAAVLVGLAAILQRGAGASFSVIGGADGPTSVFVAGKVGSLASILGTVITALNLAVYLLMIYLLVLVIRALRKYLKGE